MIETELKITLDAEGLARLRRHPELARLRRAPRRTETLVSVYYDTAGHDARRRRGRAAAAADRAAVGADGEAARAGGAGARALHATARASGRRRAGGWCWRGRTRRARSRRCARRPTAAARPGLRDAGAADERAAARRPAAARWSWRSTRGRSSRGRPARRSARPSWSWSRARSDAVYALGAAASSQRAGPVCLGEQVRARLPAGADGRRRGAGGAARAPARRRFDGEATVETVARDVLRDCLGADRRQHGGGGGQRRARGAAPASGRAAPAADGLRGLRRRASARLR